MKIHQLFILLTLGWSVQATELDEFDPLNEPAYTASNIETTVLLTTEIVDDSVYMAGERGIIIKQMTGGDWQVEDAPISATITRLIKLDTGILALAHSGSILYSSEGAEWQVLLRGSDIPQIFEQFLATSTLPETEQQALERELSGLLRDGPDKPFLSAVQVNDNAVQVFGAYGLALEIKDINKTPVIEPISQRFVDNPFMHIYGATRFNNTIYLAGEQGFLFASEDNGKRYVAVESPYHGSFFGISAIDSELYVFGMKGHVYRLITDHWQQIPIETDASIVDIKSDEQQVYVLSQAGELFTNCAKACVSQGVVNAVSSGLVLFNGNAYVSSLKGPRILEVM